jgi:hypothetical protein
MNLCDKCHAEIPTLARRLKLLNQELWRVGLDFYPTLSHALNIIERVIKEHGFNELNGVILATGNIDGSHHEEVGEGKWITISWHRFESGRYEVTAYVN